MRYRDKSHDFPQYKILAHLLMFEQQEILKRVYVAYGLMRRLCLLRSLFGVMQHSYLCKNAESDMLEEDLIMLEQ
jgi:hypothetical protein